MEEQAEATEELIATLTENHTRQMETLIKSTTDAMKEMMQRIKNQATTPTNLTKIRNKEKKKKCNKKQKKYYEAPFCSHCGRKHLLDIGQLIVLSTYIPTRSTYFLGLSAMTWREVQYIPEPPTSPNTLPSIM
jgi:hypothetical protein